MNVRWSARRHDAAARLDILRTVGFRHAWRRRRAGARYGASVAGRGARVVEGMWQDAAAELGAEMVVLSPTLIEFRLGPAVARVSQQTTPFSDPVSTRLADDKPLAYRILEEAGVPVPARAVVGAGDYAAAAAFAASTAPPFVLKPVQGAGGRGVAGQVRTLDQLKRALVHAGRFSPDVLIEQQAPGDSYRLLFLDGMLLDTLRRPQPRVVGDGLTTIESLIFREAQRRVEDESASGLKPFIVDLDCLFAIEHAGYRLDSVLPPGESIVVKSATNYNGPDENETFPAEAAGGIVGPARDGRGDARCATRRCRRGDAGSGTAARGDRRRDPRGQCGPRADAPLQRREPG